MAHPEHTLQKRLVTLTREQVSEPHELVAHDRSKARGQWTHAREKARGLKAGEPDLELRRTAGLPFVFCEVKIKPNTPTPEQEQTGARLIALGHHWFVAYSAADYVRGLRAARVLLRNTAEWAAAEVDAKAPVKAPRPRSRPSKPRAARLSKKALAFNRTAQAPRL